MLGGAIFNIINFRKLNKNSLDRCTVSFFIGFLIVENYFPLKLSERHPSIILIYRKNCVFNCIPFK